MGLRDFVFWICFAIRISTLDDSNRKESEYMPKVVVLDNLAQEGLDLLGEAADKGVELVR